MIFHIVAVYLPMLRVTLSVKLLQMPAHAEIFPEAIDLVHPLMQDRHDTDIAVREPAPMDEVPFVAKEETFNAELGGNGSGWCPVGFDTVERLEQAGDVAVGLLRPPAIAWVAIDLVTDKFPTACVAWSRLRGLEP